jgi:hypothetical protein
LKLTEISDEHVASIFKVEEQSSMKAGGKQSCACRLLSRWFLAWYIL